LGGKSVLRGVLHQAQNERHVGCGRQVGGAALAAGGHRVQRVRLFAGLKNVFAAATAAEQRFANALLTAHDECWPAHQALLHWNAIVAVPGDVVQQAVSAQGDELAAQRLIELPAEMGFDLVQRLRCRLTGTVRP